LEQLILKHKAHETTLGIKPTHEGIDFFYSNEGIGLEKIYEASIFSIGFFLTFYV